MSVEDPFLSKLKREAEEDRGARPEPEPSPESDSALPPPDSPPLTRAPRRTSARVRSTYRDRRALAFWQSRVATAFIQRRITGDEETSPASYFSELVDADLAKGAALSLRGGNPALECELLRHGACGSLTFVDNSASRLDYARARIPDELAAAVEFVQGDAGGHAPSAAVDLVVCNSTLHRFADPDAVVGRLAGWLAPGGMVYVDEYVGPDRFQWTDDQIGIVNQLLVCLPEEFRIDLASETDEIKTVISRPDEERFIRDHPSEAVASKRVREALDAHLEPVVVKPYGGAVFHQLFARIMGNFVRRPELVELILELDAILTDRGVVESDYLWGAYRRPA
jgi:SAM-dependent methyltransferase